MPSSCCHTVNYHINIFSPWPGLLGFPKVQFSIFNLYVAFLWKYTHCNYKWDNSPYLTFIFPRTRAFSIELGLFIICVKKEIIIFYWLWCFSRLLVYQIAILVQESNLQLTHLIYYWSYGIRIWQERHIPGPMYYGMSSYGTQVESLSCSGIRPFNSSWT